MELNSQELPPIEKFTPEDYGGDNQNWMISQAPNKFIYVANNEGLLEFNGAKWKMYPSPNSSVIRAVKVINDRIYTGCYMEFGFWTKDALDNLEYHSLIPKLKEKMIDDEHIWNIITYEEWILFQSHNRIYFYNTTNENITSITSKNLVSKIFKVKNIVYYHVMSEGIYMIEAGKSKLITNESTFREDRVINIFPIEEGLLIQSRESGFYTFIKGKISPWITSASNTLKKINVFNSIQLSDRSFVLGTISNGIIYLSEDGNIEYQIKQSNGLSNNTALTLFEDEDKNIWAGLDNGINCINIKSPVRVFNDDKGELGTVYTSVIFDDFLYLGTNQGLFYKRSNIDEPFRFIPNTAGQVWNLSVYDNKLFCGHHLGTFLIDKGKATMISDELGAWNFRAIPQMKNVLLQGNYNGLNILIKKDGVWSLKNKIEGFDYSARYFELIGQNEICISHGYKGVFKLKVNEGFTKVTDFFKEPKLSIGKSSSLIKYKNHLLYAYDGGVFEYNPLSKDFSKDSILSPIVTEGAYMSGKLVVDETQKLWAFSKDNISHVSINDLTNQFIIKRISIPANLRKGAIGYENISHIKNEKYLIGTSNGYLTLNLSGIDTNNEYDIILNSARLKDLGRPDLEIDINNSREFNYKENSIVFNYSVPEYNKYKIVKYQYKLIGRYDQWSDWNDKSELIFENLRFGNYRLIVRAKIGNKLTRNTIGYDFKINRPWYLSNVVLLIYLFSLFGISLITHRAYKRYYRKQHEHKQLESEQLIIRIKNEKLNQAIESKNRELAISTMSIIKKNEVLSSIKKELKNNHNSDDNISVIRLIDSNINNAKDWKFFEEAFNNVDKDFFGKVKKMYPEMTPNDLRFCAYLRLNLSSKEIAPLLNMSVKSIETKRYRLRKKMNLTHEESLVNHILEI